MTEPKMIPMSLRLEADLHQKLTDAAEVLTALRGERVTLSDLCRQYLASGVSSTFNNANVAGAARDLANQKRTELEDTIARLERLAGA